MRAITTETNVYTWGELSDAAKEHAAQIINQDHFWQADVIASLEVFAGQFGVEVKSWSYGPWGHADIETDATPSHFRGLTLAQARTLPEYPTGYCMDCTLRDVFLREFEKSGNAHVAFIKAMDAGIREARADWENQYTEERMADVCEANGYEFTEEGALT